MEGDLQLIVGANVRRLRRQMGFSQETFGEQVGWHRTFVGAVERGERNLTAKNVLRLERGLGIGPGTWFATTFDGLSQPSTG